MAHFTNHDAISLLESVSVVQLACAFKKEQQAVIEALDAIDRIKGLCKSGSEFDALDDELVVRAFRIVKLVNIPQEIIDDLDKLDLLRRVARS